MTPDPFLPQLLLSILSALAVACLGLSLLVLAVFVRSRLLPGVEWRMRLSRQRGTPAQQPVPRDRADLKSSSPESHSLNSAGNPGIASPLRLTAVDMPKLQAHQQAFVLWQRHIRSPDNRHLLESLQQCRTWWEEHCLYLEPSVRVAFAEACVHARLRSVLLQLGGHSALIARAVAKIEAFPDVLCAALGTPPLSEVERSSFLHLQPDVRAVHTGVAQVQPRDRAAKESASTVASLHSVDPLSSEAHAAEARAAEPRAAEAHAAEPNSTEPYATDVQARGAVSLPINDVPALHTDPVRHAS